MSDVFRILKNTRRDGSVKFRIEKQFDFDDELWIHITDRDTIEAARYAIEQLKGFDIVSSEVVE